MANSNNDKKNQDSEWKSKSAAHNSNSFHQDKSKDSAKNQQVADEISKEFTDSKINALFLNKHEEDAKKADQASSRHATQNTNNNEHIIKHILNRYGAAEKTSLDDDDDEEEHESKYNNNEQGITEKILVMPTDKASANYNSNNKTQGEVQVKLTVS